MQLQPDQSSSETDNIFDKENIDSDPISNKRYKFDLHGYTLDNANTKVRELIFFCLNKKYKEILLITGKGIHSDSDSDIYANYNPPGTGTEAYVEIVVSDSTPA